MSSDASHLYTLNFKFANFCWRSHRRVACQVGRTIFGSKYVRHGQGELCRFIFANRCNPVNIVVVVLVRSLSVKLFAHADSGKVVCGRKLRDFGQYVALQAKRLCKHDNGKLLIVYLAFGILVDFIGKVEKRPQNVFHVCGGKFSAVVEDVTSAVEG